MIQLKNLKKSFRTEEMETLALNDVSLHIEESEFVAIMGPSGSGKSTLLNILGMLDKPSSGSYLFNGHEVGRMSDAQRTHIRKGNLGFIFQNFNLVETLSVVENVELPLLFMKVPRRERRERAMAMLDRMKIGHRAKHFPQQLSGGQQQRVAIARAVVSQPKVIFADEPTGNLDSKNGIEVMNLLTELSRENATIVMVTHSDRDAQFAHRIVNLFDGQIAAESRNKQIISPQHL